MFNLIISFMKKEKNEELQSRREFFKKAAKGALPILGVMVLGPTVLTSCSKDDDEGSDSCKNGCSGSCSDTCSGNCFGGCTDQCHGCGGACEHSAWN